MNKVLPSNFSSKTGEVAQKYAGQSNIDKRAVADDLGMFVPETTDIELHFNNDKVNYIVFPRDPNEDLNEEALEDVAGGSGVQAAASCLSTVGSIPTCIGSASTLCLESDLGL